MYSHKNCRFTDQLLECSMNKNECVLGDSCFKMFSHKNFKIPDQFLEYSMNINVGFKFFLVEYIFSTRIAEILTNFWNAPRLKRGFRSDSCLNMFSHKIIRITDRLLECSMENNVGIEVFLV